MALKGQVNVLELVILFVISVGIFLTFFLYFINYNNYFDNAGKKLQMDFMRDVLASNIVETALKNSDSVFTYSIQKRIGNEPYKIVFNQTGLYLLTRDSISFSNVYNLNETFNFQDSSIWSLGGKVTIIKEGNNIRLIE